MKTEFIDCVEMKRRAAASIREELSGFSLEEELEYWRARTDELKERKRAVGRTERVTER